jgi:hypothetical protein
MEAKTIIAGFIVIIWCIAAAKTLVPNQEASKPCWLGYRAMCSFTPFSTVFLLIGAAATYVVAKNLGIL